MSAVTVGTVWEALDEVIDPELGVPITELGLVYDVQITDGVVAVEMTTTTPVCPLGSYMQMEIERRLGGYPDVTSVQVAIVHSPPWHPDLMSDTARRMLGWAV